MEIGAGGSQRDSETLHCAPGAPGFGIISSGSNRSSIFGNKSISSCSNRSSGSIFGNNLIISGFCSLGVPGGLVVLVGESLSAATQH